MDSDPPQLTLDCTVIIIFVVISIVIPHIFLISELFLAVFLVFNVWVAVRGVINFMFFLNMYWVLVVIGHILIDIPLHNPHHPN